MQRPHGDPDLLEALIVEAKASGGSELANYQLFVERLTVALGLPRPAMAQERNELNDYVFERRVDFKHPDGSRTAGRIDCYRRGCFILEAKQSAKRRAAKADPGQPSPIPEDAAQRKQGQARRGSRGWDLVMLAARKQAEDYARALPVEHGYPPFLLVVDVGHVIEVFADFSCQGKNYAHFPDRRTYRVAIDDLRDDKVQARLKAIWTEPQTLDPARISAEVTREIAERLGRIAKRLEGRHDARDVAEFLMRCLFTMFAEDVKLIPDKGFHKLLGKMKETPQNFVPALETLWATMDSGGYAPSLNATLKRFNGALFKNGAALPLEKDDIHELWVAAGKDWQDVEPAIFGALLERALDPRERSQLGAHYTPRAYVERLVAPTIIEPLRAEWELVKGQVKELRDKGDDAGAIKAVKAYHHMLCTTRCPGPCLRHRQLPLCQPRTDEAARGRGAGGAGRPRARPGALRHGGRNGRAAAVLWPGAQPPRGSDRRPRAVDRLSQMADQDVRRRLDRRTRAARLRHDPSAGRGNRLRPAGAFARRSRQAGFALGRGHEEAAPDHGRGDSRPGRDSAALRLRQPETRAMAGGGVHRRQPAVHRRQGHARGTRRRLCGGLLESASASSGRGGLRHALLGRGRDHFWDEAATRLTRRPLKGQTNPLRRFGFITTNSITQTFSRRVIEARMAAREPLSLVYAVPDHPWLKAAGKAAVRIAMTVAIAGTHTGVLAEVASEAALDTDTPEVELKCCESAVRADLTVGADLSAITQLNATDAIAHMGVKLHGEGFIVSLQSNPRLLSSKIVHPFVNGRDISQSPRNLYVIDTFGLAEDDLRKRYPALYQLLLESVKPERDLNRRDFYRTNWWIWGEPRREWREAKYALHRFIGTTRTSRHRVFQMIAPDTVIESKIVGFALADAAMIAVLSSRLHVQFALRTGGWLGAGNDPTYNHSDCFNRFPFPIAVDPALPHSSPLFAQQERLRELGERLDAFRKARLAEHSFLTMTGLYNALERLRELESGVGAPFSDAERDVHRAGLVSVLKEIHDDIDRAVFAAYGWEDLIPHIVGRPGATLPSPHRSEAQETAEEELLTRLVALNLERAAEEKRGFVRWLRPDYQIPKLAAKAPKPKDEHVGALDVTAPAAAERLKWPQDGLEQIRLVRDLLARAPAPAPPDMIAGRFEGRVTPRRRDRIAEVLETLVATGAARTGDHEGQRRYFLPR